VLCKGDSVTHRKQQKSFYQEKLTEESANVSANTIWQCHQVLIICTVSILMASAVARAYNGVWGLTPAGPGAQRYRGTCALKRFGNHVQNFRLNISCFWVFVSCLHAASGLWPTCFKRNVTVLATACDWTGERQHLNYSGRHGRIAPSLLDPAVAQTPLASMWCESVVRRVAQRVGYNKLATNRKCEANPNKVVQSRRLTTIAQHLDMLRCTNNLMLRCCTWFVPEDHDK